MKEQIKSENEYKKTKIIVKILEGIKVKGKKDKERKELIERGKKLIEEYEKRNKNE